MRSSVTGFSKCGISLMLPTSVGTMLGCPPGRGSKNDDCRNSASFIWFSGAILNSFGSVPCSYKASATSRFMRDWVWRL